MIPTVPRKRTPSPDQHTYQTSDGLIFWMDYVRAGAPYVAPTIHTTDPAIRIILVPTGLTSDDVYLMHHYGTVIPFSRPTWASLMHDNRLDQLREDHPDLDLPLTGICQPFQWAHYFDKDIRLLDIPSSAGFGSAAEQTLITNLLCQLLAPLARFGPISMSRGDKPAGTVGFATDLQRELDSGRFIVGAGARGH